MKASREDRIINIISYSALTFVAFLMLYPFWNSLVISFNDGLDTSKGGITFWPRIFTLINYKTVFEDPRIMGAFLISIMRTIIGTTVGVLATSLFAFGLSKKKLKGRKYYTWISVFTMYFGGGLIPFYLLMRSLGLIDKFWVLILVTNFSPAVISVFNMIIFRSFFLGIPKEIEESAKMDGAGYYQLFFRIILQISVPVFASITLFTAVQHWNAWFDAAIFINSPDLIPIQTLLRQIINSNALTQLLQLINGAAADQMLKTRLPFTTKSLTMSTTIIATLPILIVYPFLQRYFIKGIMIGSLKE